MVKNYVPDRGDIVTLNFNPQAGKEQAGKRPALILSPKEYNEKVGLAIMCPITSRTKNYPFEVELGPESRTKGVILADHVKNLDWIVRNAKFTEKVDQTILNEVLGKLRVLIR